MRNTSSWSADVRAGTTSKYFLKPSPKFNSSKKDIATSISALRQKRKRKSIASTAHLSKRLRHNDGAFGAYDLTRCMISGYDENYPVGGFHKRSLLLVDS